MGGCYTVSQHNITLLYSNRTLLNSFLHYNAVRCVSENLSSDWLPDGKKELCS